MSIEQKAAKIIELKTGPEPLPELPRVAEFKMGLLPKRLQPWVTDIAERMQVPPEVLGVSGVVEAGAILGRKIGIRPQSKTDWTEVPNLWGMVVGRPGTMKSPAISQAMAPIKRLAANARDVHREHMKAHQGLMDDYRQRSKAAEKRNTKALDKNPDAKLDRVEEPVEPHLRRYVANDSNLASLSTLLQQNPNGLLVDQDEIMALLKRLDRTENAEERAFYLTAWGGMSGYTQDRIARGLNLHIESVTLSVFGGTQPAKIESYLKEAIKGTGGDDGLIQRFSLLVWPEFPPVWRNVDRYPDSEARNLAFEVFRGLDDLAAGSVKAHTDTYSDIPYLRFDPAAQAAFDQWHEALQNRIRGDELHPAMASHLSKYRKTIPALALIFHLIDGEVGNVGLRALTRALAWGEYLESHARRAYGSVTNATTEAAKLILRRMDKLPDEFTARDVRQKGWAGLTGPEQVKDALDMLADYRHLAATAIPTSDSGGRPTVIYTARNRS